MTKSTIAHSTIAKAIIFLLAFVLYANTISHQYALDDAIVITNNIYVQQGLSGIPDILTTDTFTGFFKEKKNLVSGGRYRPLSLVTFAIEYQMFGLNPSVSHFINILLYGLTGIILFNLLTLLFASYKSKTIFMAVPFLASVLFMAHPIHTEVVANIKGRDEILSLLFSLLALTLCVRWFTNRNNVLLVYSSISMFLALMAKENAITFLAIAPITIYFFTEQKPKKILLASLPLLAATMLFLYIRGSVIGNSFADQPNELMNNPFLEAKDNAQRYATIFYTLGIYIKLLFFPHPLTFDYYPYHIPLMNVSNWQVIVSVLVYLTIGIWALATFHKKSVVSYAIIFYLATLSIVSNLFFPIGAFMNERFIYFSSVGFAIIVAYTFFVLYNKYHNKKQIQTSLIILGVLISLLFTYKTIHRNKAWENDLTLFTTDVKTSFRSAKSTCSAGGKILEASETITDTALKQQQISLALSYLRQSVAIHPTYRDALLLLGNAHFQNNRNIDSTLFYYRKILASNPNYNLVWDNIEKILAGEKNIDRKILIYEDLSTINANRFEVNYNLGNLYGKHKQNIERALFYLEKAVSINPKSSVALKDYGVALAISGNFQKSITIFMQALQQNPDDKDIYINIALTYQQLGDIPKAQQYLAKANSLK